jgi:hypothetical protein
MNPPAKAASWHHKTSCHGTRLCTHFNFGPHIQKSKSLQSLHIFDTHESKSFLSSSFSCPAPPVKHTEPAATALPPFWPCALARALETPSLRSFPTRLYSCGCKPPNSQQVRLLVQPVVAHGFYPKAVSIRPNLLTGKKKINPTPPRQLLLETHSRTTAF